MPTPLTAAFFDRVRPMFGGHLSELQVEGIEDIASAWGREGDGDPRKLAYLLATAKHETAETMQPVYERGNKSYFDKYEPNTKRGAALGNDHKGDGYLFRGRGYVQLTGRANYRKFGIEASPDDAMEPVTAAHILVSGCLKGAFTSRKLGDFIGPVRTDYVNARRVINGTDKADLIATFARTFADALK